MNSGALSRSHWRRFHSVDRSHCLFKWRLATFTGLDVAYER